MESSPHVVLGDISNLLYRTSGALEKSHVVGANLELVTSDSIAQNQCDEEEDDVHLPFSTYQVDTGVASYDETNFEDMFGVVDNAVLDPSGNPDPIIEDIPDFDEFADEPDWLANGTRDLSATAQNILLEELVIHDVQNAIESNQPWEFELLKQGFRQLDVEEVEQLKSGGPRKSIYMERWARNRFDDWRKLNVCCCMDPIEDMFLYRVGELVEMLSQFMLEVQCKDGKLYLGETLVTMLRAIGRIIRGKLEADSVENKTVAEKFYIIDDPRFKKVCVSCLIAVKRSVKAGIGRKRKITTPLTYEMGQQLLASPILCRTDRKGCVLRVACYTQFLCSSTN